LTTYWELPGALPADSMQECAKNRLAKVFSDISLVFHDLLISGLFMAGASNQGNNYQLFQSFKI